MIKNWQILNEEEVSPSPWFRVFKRKYKMGNGKIIDDFFVSKLGDVAMVLLKTEDNKIVFVRQYKPGFGKIMLELPAGRVKAGSTPEEGARLELIEETGFEIKDLTRIGEFSEMPTKDPMCVYAFYATGVLKKGLQKLDETEEIEVVLIPENKIDRMIENGEIQGSSALATILMAKIKGLIK